MLIGLAVRLLERRGAFQWPLPNLRRLRPTDPVIVLAAGGLLAYVVYLWRTFDEPFAFAEAAAHLTIGDGRAPILRYSSSFSCASATPLRQ